MANKTNEKGMKEKINKGKTLRVVWPGQKKQLLVEVVDLDP
jgi:hypothetical protein